MPVYLKWLFPNYVYGCFQKHYFVVGAGARFQLKLRVGDLDLYCKHKLCPSTGSLDVLATQPQVKWKMIFPVKRFILKGINFYFTARQATALSVFINIIYR